MNTDMNTIITEQEYENALAIIAAYKKQLQERIAQIDAVDLNNLHVDPIAKFRITKLIDMDLSRRTINVLAPIFDDTHIRWYQARVQDLAMFSRHQYRLARNCGKKTLDEIETICEKADIQLRIR
jgi:hypothetical protein